MAVPYTKQLDKKGLPVISVQGVGVTFNLHMSVTVFEIPGDTENYLVKQPLSGIESIVPRKDIDKHYVKWDGCW